LLTDALAAGDPTVDPLARRYLGSTLFRMGLPTEAEQALLPLVRSQDAEQWPEALLLLGRVLAADDRPEEAYPWLRRAIECGDGETSAEAREVYAELLRSRGRGERAHEVRAPLMTPGVGEGQESEGRKTEGPSDSSPPAPTPGCGPDPASSASPLPPVVLGLLGDVADAEGKQEEAAFWYALAGRTRRRL
jgi:tetratricopeptide (TPR) repeat protein